MAIQRNRMFLVFSSGKCCWEWYQSFL